MKSRVVVRRSLVTSLQEEASDLANILRAGKLDAPARIIQADVVGPSLGKEAISDSINSFAIALLHWCWSTCTSTTAVQVWWLT